MKIYIFVDGPEADDSAEPISQEITLWVEQREKKHPLITSVNKNDNDDALPTIVLGLELETTNKDDLKEPLNFLYRVAKNHQVEFVVGSIEQNSGKRTPICYFGHEEGRPDLFEIAHYVGLKS